MVALGQYIAPPETFIVTPYRAGRRVEEAFPQFRFSLNVRQALLRLRAMGAAVRWDELEPQVKALMDSMVATLSRTTPGPATDPRLANRRKLKDLWRVAMDRLRTGERGEILRYRVENTTRYRVLLRWLESGTVDRGKAIIKPGRRAISAAEYAALPTSRAKQRRLKGLATKAPWLVFPAGSWPAGSGPRNVNTGISSFRKMRAEGGTPGAKQFTTKKSRPAGGKVLPGTLYYMFRQVHRKGIKPTRFFATALADFDTAVDILYAKYKSRIRQAGQSKSAP